VEDRSRNPCLGQNGQEVNDGSARAGGVRSLGGLQGQHYGLGYSVRVRVPFHTLHVGIESYRPQPLKVGVILEPLLGDHSGGLSQAQRQPSHLRGQIQRPGVVI
jgi:hypothetical protein